MWLYASRPASLRRAACDHGVDIEHFFGAGVGLVVRRLRAVRAVFGATAGLHAEERAELHLVVGVVRAVNGACLVEERKERAIVERADVRARERRDGGRLHRGARI